MKTHAIRLLLWLWKVLPLPDRMRWALLWAGNTKFLVGALAVVFDDEGRVLLQRHSYRQRNPWGMPGGWLRGGERPEEALAREVAEETGLRVTVGPLVAAHVERKQPELVLFYLCSGSGEPRLSVESTAVGYFALDDLPAGVPPFQLPPIEVARRVWRELHGKSQY